MAKSEEVWERIPNKPAKHGWAFFYYLKRCGDKPRVTVHEDGSITIKVERHNES